MKLETKRRLLEAWHYCDIEDKSTDFMIEYMMDVGNVGYDCVLNFIEKTTLQERQKYINTLK